MINGTKKKLIWIFIPVAVVLIAIVALILWDPADMLRLRKVARAEGTYLVEEADVQEIGFSFQSIVFSDDEAAVVILDGGDKRTLKTSYSVSENTTIVIIDYGQSTYSLFCKRKSNDFKLVGTTPCDYLICSVHKLMTDNETIIGRFTAIK